MKLRSRTGDGVEKKQVDTIREEEDADLEKEYEVQFTELPSEDEVQINEDARLNPAVLHGTDWTTETVVGQLKRGNIILNPSFQRRDAWSRLQKSRFVESLIIGLPIPQIVLAESKTNRGQFIVLDGKQRLLSILQFWGLGEGDKNGYALTGLEVLTELNRLRYADLELGEENRDFFNALQNQSIRTVVIRNWPNIDFLHTVFLRLNTGSVKLSPQELRQALFPGAFSDWVDVASANSVGIKRLLNLKDPDYRMRDIEILARFLAFRFYINGYGGRMKNFIDSAFDRFNKNWKEMQGPVQDALEDFEAAITVLIEIFGNDVARKPDSRPFNRAIFDYLVFYAQRAEVREKIANNPAGVLKAYTELFLDTDFRAAVERDTASVPNTALRLSRWGQKLNTLFKLRLPLPAQDPYNNLTFPGFRN
ncbi:DUF262 domain-containing protein [Singulisphaera sp. Ch08]|uniref:DUF262 domain-containing protein n=1 Tax=Singulisphaera sp. Ch08 TaxID=3120278 RepID=A0AAU7CRU8_9BACT